MAQRVDRFRFRAYRDGVMYEPWNIYDGSEGGFSAETILMQCTGLRDSEGVLIWEGDLIEIKLDDYKHNHLNATGDDIVTPVVRNVCEVRYRPHGGFVALVKNEPYKGNVLRLKDSHDKVLGNIYENPGILGGRKLNEPEDHND